MDLSDDNRFNKSIALVGPRRDLNALADDIAAQSKLKLSVAPAFASDAQVLALSNGMKVGEAMAALERLYHAAWVPAGDGYVLRPRNLSQLQQTLSEMGDQVHDGSKGRDLADRFFTGARLAEEVSVNFDPKQLQSPEGAPFSQLSPAIQAEIVQLLREDNRQSLAETQQRVEEVLDHINDFTIYLGNYPQKMVPFFAGQGSRWGHDVNFNGGIGLAAFVSNASGDHFVAQIFPTFSVRPPTDFDAELFAQQATAQQEAR